VLLFLQTFKCCRASPARYQVPAFLRRHSSPDAEALSRGECKFETPFANGARKANRFGIVTVLISRGIEQLYAKTPAGPEVLPGYFSWRHISHRFPPLEVRSHPAT
jgi:hypothetical protein